MIGAERVKLWRSEELQRGSDFSQISDSGGEVWLNNGTALYRGVDVSDYGVLSNEIGDTRTTHDDTDKEPKLCE